MLLGGACGSSRMLGCLLILSMGRHIFLTILSFNCLYGVIFGPRKILAGLVGFTALNMLLCDVFLFLTSC